jgi:hypothetical protein
MKFFTCFKYFLLFIFSLLLLTGCSEDNVTGVSSDRVTDPFPLALGNRWEYALEQSIFVHEDTTKPPITESSTGRQVLTIDRTEMITGDEAFGVTFYHVMDFLFTEGADTVLETHYLAPRGEKLLLKAEEAVYNPTGGFIPFSKTNNRVRIGTKIKIGGVSRFISLERLAHLLLDTGGLIQPAGAGSGLALASDGIQNKDNVVFYPDDYIFVFNELYKGRNWVSAAAQGVGEVNITQEVTNILSELGEFDGPIAEVELLNRFIVATASEQYKIRFYYKSGVGLVQAEISDPEFMIWRWRSDGSIEFLGIGTWTFIKKLVDYTVK